MITTNFSDLTANEARQAIYNLTCIYSWETIGSEMISRMSGDEARSFFEDFTNLYTCDIDEDEDEDEDEGAN